MSHQEFLEEVVVRESQRRMIVASSFKEIQSNLNFLKVKMNKIEKIR